MLTKKFREVNCYSSQVWDRAPLDIELIRNVIIIIIIIIIVIAYYRSLFTTRAVNTCQIQSLRNLHVLFL
jgi:hypothetical protein